MAGFPVTTSSVSGGVQALGTVAASCVIPTPTAQVLTATTTAGSVCAFTLPQAVIGTASFDLLVTNPASGTVDVPTFAAHAGDTINWVSTLEWNTAAGSTTTGVNIISFEVSATGVWQASPVTSGLGAAAPIQDQTEGFTGSSGTVTFVDPLVSPYYMQQRYSAPGGAVIFAMPTPGAGKNFMAYLEPGGTYGFTLPAASGTVRYVGATTATFPIAAPSIPASSVCILTANCGPQGTIWDISVGRSA